ncbi:MAG: histidine triad (HIT) protein [Microgenomates group bacterium Gr01-1014_5]|nr:MAG: histidine triad (HIT) protein [Microgenomates group bacterium Gr01-1014_5]
MADQPQEPTIVQPSPPVAIPTAPAEDCIFCKIVRGEAPVHKIWEDSEHMAFLSIFPNTPGFTVVITKVHHPSYAFANSDEILTKLTLAAKKVGELLDLAFEDVGRTGLMYEGFGVNHLHAKLFPMHGTGNMETWEPIKSPLKTFFDQYPGFMSSHDADKADDAQLEAQASKIRNKAKQVAELGGKI